MCFLSLPVDRPPMEPSQFVSVVPKYPDKMGFDEVGKVHTCACMWHACTFILEHKPDDTLESLQDRPGC